MYAQGVLRQLRPIRGAPIFSVAMSERADFLRQMRAIINDCHRPAATPPFDQHVRQSIQVYSAAK
jgi:hypothetical protein